MPLEQHLVPQEISSYEFRLVGDMTLKQFLQLAGGAGVGFVIFVTPLPAFIKWPFVVFAALSGAALAFLPYEERPLSFWIASFLRAIYSPTFFSWQTNASEDVFARETAMITPKIITPQGSEKAEIYLHTTPQPAENLPFEAFEKSFLKRFSDMFGISRTTSVKTEAVSAPQAFTENAVPLAPTPIPVKIEPQVKNFPPPAVSPHTATLQPMSPVFNPSPQNTKAQGAIFNLEAAPPNPPEQPNIIVGQVVTNDGKIVDSAILEVREVGGNPVRALRTNRVGHFLTVTPVKDGLYEIETEKEGLQFDVVQIKVEGKIIPPILIRAK